MVRFQSKALTVNNVVLRIISQKRFASSFKWTSLLENKYLHEKKTRWKEFLPGFLSLLAIVVSYLLSASTPSHGLAMTKLQQAQQERQQTSALVEPSRLIMKPNNLHDSTFILGAKKLHMDGLTGERIRVAVIDDGIDHTHPGFHGMIQKTATTNPTQQQQQHFCKPDEFGDHGTFVAGIIHAMAPEADIVDYPATRTACPQEAMLVETAIRRATDEGAHIINMSIIVDIPDLTKGLLDAIRYAHSKGVILVCGAGNDRKEADDDKTHQFAYPANYRQCISVAAVANKRDFPVAHFSNQNNRVNYASIGVNVTSLANGGGYKTDSGTSFSAPHITGLIACLLTHGRHSAKNIRQILNDLSVDVGLRGFDQQTGAGFPTYLDHTEVQAEFARRETWDTTQDFWNRRISLQFYNM